MASLTGGDKIIIIKKRAEICLFTEVLDVFLRFSAAAWGCYQPVKTF